MRVLVAGDDGFCGWPTALCLSARGYEVLVDDNFSRRGWDEELDTESLTRISALTDRVGRWRELTGREIGVAVGDLNYERFVYEMLDGSRPEAFVHSPSSGRGRTP